MSMALASGEPARRRYRLRRLLAEAGSVMLGVVLLIWSLLPIYEMLQIALDPEEGEIEFSGNIWPAGFSLDGFRDVVTQQARYLDQFWHQFGNSLYIGVATAVITLMIGSLASFAVSRMRLSRGSLLTNAALLTYAIPASFLIVPFLRIMHAYGLSDNHWAVIVAEVTFAVPFAILILQLYANLIPTELDDAARVDGASALQVYLRIYLPLMAPALAVVAIYSLLLAWNEYLYPAMLLSPRNMTIGVTQGLLFTDTDAEWNAMMAAAVIAGCRLLQCCLPSAATSRRALRWKTLVRRADRFRPWMAPGPKKKLYANPTPSAQPRRDGIQTCSRVDRPRMCPRRSDQRSLLCAAYGRR